MTPPGAEAGFHLSVGDGHRIRVSCHGDSAGIPVVLLHGGPGSGCQPDQLAMFDLTRMFVIMVDQRGAGRSLPHGCRDANTTAHLVADLELLRRHLGLSRWMLVGGSWGATLALAYGQAHPERVTGIVLRATFLGTRAELDWAFCTALPQFYPAMYQDFLAILPEDERATPLEGYWARILHPDPAVHRPAALAWYRAERALSQLEPAVTRLDVDAGVVEGPMPATPFMEAHYFSQNCFLPDGALMAGVSRIAQIPGIVVQARYDLLCPPATSHALVARWPAARVRMVEASGHALSQPRVAEAVRLAIADLASQGARQTWDRNSRGNGQR